MQRKSFGDITLIRVTLKCPVCGKEWGIKENSLEELQEDIKKGDKFICFNCRFNNSTTMEKDGNGYDYSQEYKK
jgi:hypothetical protein